jgi:hypothetical protein
VLLHEALTGRSPWGRSRAESDPLRRHALGAPLLAEVTTEAPAGLEAVLQRLLAARPADRPLRAEDVRDQLRALGATASDAFCVGAHTNDAAEAELRGALIGALEGRPSALVLIAPDREPLEAFIDAWEGRLRRGALDARVNVLRAVVGRPSLGLTVSIARDVPQAEGSLSRALRRFVTTRESSCALAVATMATSTPPPWLAELRRTGAVQLVELGADTAQDPAS